MMTSIIRMVVLLTHLLVSANGIVSGESFTRRSQPVRTWLDNGISESAIAYASWTDLIDSPRQQGKPIPPIDAFKSTCGQFKPLENEQYKGAFGCANEREFAGQSRLSGGIEVAANNAPYYAQSIGLFDPKGFQTCGGTIIHKNLILTAAHCVNETGAKLSALGFVVGSNEFVFNPQDPPKHDGKFVKATKIFVNPKYSGTGIEYPTHDIAIVKLAEDLVYNERVQPACMTLERAPRNDARCFIAARGNINVNHDKPKSLMAHMVSLESGSYDKSEAESFKWYAHARGNNCHGDSGSGLICYDDCDGKGLRGYVVGVTSAVSDMSVCDVNDRKDATNYMNVRGLRNDLMVLMLSALLDGTKHLS